MKKLVRGGSIAVLASLLVAFIYAQTSKPVGDLIIAKESQPTIAEDNILNNNLVSDSASVIETAPATDDKKLVKTTASTKAAGAGGSRGSFSATAYCLKGRTAMGHGVRRGLIAADPRVLRLGSRVYVNAGQWSGTYLVSDTGTAIKGKKIDIWVPGCGEARKFGRRTVQVFSAQ
ncbi:MAG: 3D domain-containing protein [Chloracidobacterium sp.]|nr:3D domain-containing protein [Chloracidobacterium sp.]